MDTKDNPLEEKLFKEITEIKAKEWDLFIAKLKKSTPVPDVELEEMWNTKQKLRNSIEDFYLINSSFEKAHSRQLMTLTQKMYRDTKDIYDNFTEED